MSDYPMLISNKLHSFRNFDVQMYQVLIGYEKYNWRSRIYNRY